MHTTILTCGCVMMFLDDVTKKNLDRDAFLVHQKPGHLLDAYEDFFSTIEVNGFVRMLEIGVKHGGSLAYWREKLPKCVVVGVDTNPQVPAKTLEHFKHAGGIEFHSMDGTSPEMLSLGKFDLIVDDGEHSFADITASYRLLWPMVNPGGCYIIEDWYAACSESSKLIAHLGCDGPYPIIDTWASGEICPTAPIKMTAWKHMIALQKQAA